METKLFVLFPEYVDVGRTLSAPYVQGFVNIYEDRLPDPVSEILKMIKFFSYERMLRYYDGQNVKGVDYPTQLLYPNSKNVLSTILHKRGFEDWRSSIKHMAMRATYNGITCIDDTCRYIHELNTTKEVAVLVASPTAVVMKNISMTDDQNIAFSVECQQTVHQLYDWLSKNRNPPRIFDYNPKHGDISHKAQYYTDRKGQQHRAAQLMCSVDHAQELLHKAVGDDGVYGDLWCFDPQYNRYIYYENQKEIRNAYHGYHLNPGDKGYEKVNQQKYQDANS